MCACTPTKRTPCCETCPYELQIKGGLIKPRNDKNINQRLINLRQTVEVTINQIQILIDTTEKFINDSRSN